MFKNPFIPSSTKPFLSYLVPSSPGVSLGFLWGSYGNRVAFLWDFHDMSMVFLWDHSRTAMESKLKSSENQLKGK